MVDYRKILKDFDDMDKLYKYNWELMIYSLDPTFHK